MMKLFRILLLVLGSLVVACTSTRSQDVQEQATWTVALEKTNTTEFDLVFNAEILKGWYLYSAFIDPAVGPIPTSFNFLDTSKVDFSLKGPVSEAGIKTYNEHDPIWDAPIKKFASGATFTQKITAANPNAIIKGYIEFMACDDEKCLPPVTIDFYFDLGKGVASLPKSITNQ